MRHLHVVSVLAFLGFFAPPPSLAHAQEVGKVAGTVTDRATGASLAGGQVTVVGTRLGAGKAAGLTVNTPSGNPAAGTEILLRGFGTLNAATSPLVLVDGVPGDLKTIAPQDVASVNVLKDASAAAIYGSRAANGVILIPTRRQESAHPDFP